VPEILVDDTQGRVLLLEDLGDETFGERLAEAPRARWLELYAEAAQLLARMHERCERGEPSESIAFRRSFDRKLLRWELDHFRRWGLERMYGPLEGRDAAELVACFEALCDQLGELRQGFVHRDYQSRNLMYAPDGTLTVIDFQDALRGPLVYDLVALLCDSYVDLDSALQRATLDCYAVARDFSAAQTSELHRAFHLVAVQRKLKDAGRFVFIDQVRGNPSFLPYFGQSLRYAGRAVAALDDPELSGVLRMRVPGFPDAVATPLARTSSAAGWVEP
jgi:aminoglycoside/choline kinase family phosphotransferase